MNTVLRHWLSCTLWLLLTASAPAFYDSHIGRWINRDPIGEDGGENVYGFVENSPVAFIDALGEAKRNPTDPPRQEFKLDYRVIMPLQAGNCGSWKWHVAWTLSPAPTSGGYIIQVVKRKGKRWKCGENRRYGTDKGYREAWSVYAGGGMSFGGQDIYANVLEDDLSVGNGYGACTAGEDEIEGFAVYYDGLKKLPGDFKPRGGSDGRKHSAGFLPATNRPGPSLPWNNLPDQSSSNEVHRRVKISWDCCSGIKQTKIEEVRP